uniref:Orf74 n=1 Tax=Malawimonas jakobiformis TaxID=136089 RepID=Q9G891_MALJA|nr:orf74 [Malawimonas jakobiformis]AAG13682.1 orf74 [Malawimonas jakobiformis]
MIKKINLETKNNKIYFKIAVSTLKNNKYQTIDNIGIYNIKYNYILLNKIKLNYYLSVGALLTKNLIKILKKFNI